MDESIIDEWMIWVDAKNEWVGEWMIWYISWTGVMEINPSEYYVQRRSFLSVVSLLSADHHSRGDAFRSPFCDECGRGLLRLKRQSVCLLGSVG